MQNAGQRAAQACGNLAELGVCNTNCIGGAWPNLSFFGLANHGWHEFEIKSHITCKRRSKSVPPDLYIAETTPAVNMAITNWIARKY